MQGGGVPGDGGKGRPHHSEPKEDPKDLGSEPSSDLAAIEGLPGDGELLPEVYKGLLQGSRAPHCTHQAGQGLSVGWLMRSSLQGH